MPVVDMPVEKLLKYRGSSPCPADFDTYWETALAEMAAVEPDVELLPTDIQVPYADCFDMYFTGTGGSRVYAQLLKPKNAPAKPMPAVALFHGYGGNSGDWSSKLPYVAAGYTVAAMDCRGQGGLSEDSGSVIGNTKSGHIIRGLDEGPEKLYYKQVFLDCAQLAGLLMEMPEVDETRVGSAGGSQGGALALVCAALEPRINRTAPMYPFLSDYKRVWDMDMDKEAYAEMRQYFRNFDPTHAHEDEFFERLGYIDIQNLARRIKARVMMATGLIDEVCPASTQFAAYNKIEAAKEVIFYPDFGHEGLPGHNDRTLQFMLEMR